MKGQRQFIVLAGWRFLVLRIKHPLPYLSGLFDHETCMKPIWPETDVKVSFCFFGRENAYSTFSSYQQTQKLLCPQWYYCWWRSSINCVRTVVCSESFHLSRYRQLHQVQYPWTGNISDLLSTHLNIILQIKALEITWSYGDNQLFVLIFFYIHYWKIS